MKKNKEFILLILISIFLFLLSFYLMFIYLFNDNTTIDIPQPEIIEKEEENKIKIVDEDSNDRPIAVMIDNNVGNEAHIGLQQAYLTYEIIVEGGITRLMPIYKDIDVSVIGPVRSARHYFLDYALENDAIYTHYGWSTFAERDISVLGVDNLNGISEDNAFWRDNQIKAPHNVFTGTEKIKNYYSIKNKRTMSNKWKLLNYSLEDINLNEKTNFKEANKISIDYSYLENRSYSYDSVNKYYLRSSDGSAHKDRITRTQLNYKNILIIYTKNRTIDSEGRQDLQTTGQGTGYYITNGYYVPINWTKSTRSAKTKYIYENGNEIELNDGNTIIQIVPIDSKINIE